MTVDLAALRAPFRQHEHSWRAQSLARDGKRAQALCYITARAVQNRLDDVCTPAGWECNFVETRSGRVIATISIDFDGRPVAKSDGAGATAMEGEKGGMSDAFKRAAVMWGIGRYLYGMPSVWAECESIDNNGKPRWRKWTERGLCELDDALLILFRRLEGHAEPPRRLPPPRPPIDLQPHNEPPPPLALTNAPALPMPAEIRRMLAGLDDVLRGGGAEQFWAEHWPKVPELWRAFVRDEKERLKALVGEGTR
jgi:hypothetical protein